jgi:hypothetical protein
MIYVIDRNSLINLMRYYPFDKGEEYNKFKNFFKSKFENKEIRIIDKVNKEGINWIKKEFGIKQELIINTEDNLINLNEVANNENNINKNHKIKDIETDKENQKNYKADLSLIAYCKKLKNENKEVCLISDETKLEKFNTKLYKKIPNMCLNYDIECKNLPTLIFNKFNEEIKINVEIVEEEQINLEIGE